MRLVPAIISILLLPGVVCAGSVEMPAWNSSGEAANYTLGGGLWPKGILAGTPTKETGKSAKSLLAKNALIEEKLLAANAGANLIGDNATLLADQMELLKSESEGIPQKVDLLAAIAAEQKELQEQLQQQAIIEVLPPIEGELQDRYFAHAPVDFLVDPQDLLTEQKSNDLSRFLEFHSDEAKFHIYVFVLGETQDVPSGVSLKKLHAEWFDENPTALMVYHREHPEKTQIVYNASVQSSLPKSVFNRILENCLREGASTENAPDQVEKISVELSIQLYWLARLMERQVEMKEATSVAPVKAGNSSAIVDTLAVESPVVVAALKENDNNAPVIVFEAEEESAWGSNINWFQVLGLLGGVAFLALIVWAVIWWRRRDGINGNPMLFPDCEVTHRLGGEFSGGTFVGMSFEIGDGDD